MGKKATGFLVVWLVCVCSCAAAQDVVAKNPWDVLRPPDRSSPRAAVKTFLESGDAFCMFLSREYLESPSRAGYDRLMEMGAPVTGALNLSEVPPASHAKAGAAAAFALYETLCRIPLALDELPDSAKQADGTAITRWAIPDTAIVLVRAESGPHTGDFLFSTETVARAGRFHEQARNLPYARPVPLEAVHDLLVSGGGWMIPYSWVQAMPYWLRAPIAGQAAWKWIALALVLGVFLLLLRWVFRLSRWDGVTHPILRSLTRMAMPAFFLAAAPVLAHLTLTQINMRGGVGSSIELAATAILFLAGAWIAWQATPLAAEAVIASPRISPDSIDAHLLRICARLLGIVLTAVMLGVGADRLGVPVYGIMAGFGVGGLAIALAAQASVENLIGGLSLFADKPVRVGELCRYGNQEGIVEAIGLRSTRIRGLDRTLTTVTNAELAKIAIVNLAERDRILIQNTFGVRSETTPEQLRYLLAKIREMLWSHPRIHAETARVRFIGFGPSSLQIEVFAYAMTRTQEEFLGIREDVWLRVMDIVAESGTAIAIPSQTVYFTRDKGVEGERGAAAEDQVRQWRGEGRMPSLGFPT